MARSAVFQALKAALKARGVTYRDLAEHLGLSESGIKKMLTAKDFPLGRLIEICDWLGVSAAEMVSLMESEEIREVELTRAQQEAFMKDTSLFRVYWRLSIENETPETIRTGEGLTTAAFERTVLKLQRLDLVTVSVSGIPRTRHHGLVRWAPGNPLVDRLNRDWSRNLVDAALKFGDENSPLHRLVSLRLSQDSLSDLERALQDTVDEFARRSRREEVTKRPSDLRSYRLLIAGARGRFIDSN